MKTKFPAIDLADFFSLLAVWELNDEHCWELLSIERLLSDRFMQGTTIKATSVSN